MADLTLEVSAHAGMVHTTIQECETLVSRWGRKKVQLQSPLRRFPHLLGVFKLQSLKMEQRWIEGGDFPWLPVRSPSNVLGGGKSRLCGMAW